MKRRLLAIFIISLVGIIALTGCSSTEAPETDEGPEVEGTDEESADNGAFIVGMEAGYPPFNWTQMDDSNGGVPIDGAAEYAGGYDVEIAKLIAEGLGKELLIVKTEWDGLQPALDAGMLDAVIAGMSPTADRAKEIDFSDNYYNSDLVMVINKGSEYENATSIQDFSGAKVTAQLNTFHYSVIDQIDGVVKETAMDNFPAMRVALESGILDGYISERPEAISASSANDNFTFVEFEDGFEASEDDTAVAVGLIKGSDLREEINEILSTISQDQRQEIMDAAILNQPAAQ